MKWTIPGTVLQIPREEADQVESLFNNMFLAGGMVLSQVSGVTGLESYAVQNWVKRGFLSPPRQKRYTMRQLCRIININMLRAALPMEQICRLLSYINGNLNDEGDDLIDDSVLYFLFVKLAAKARQLDDPAIYRTAMSEVLADYKEPIPGARERVEKVLQVMLTAFVAARMRDKAEEQLSAILSESIQ